jgi:hypothetical protein
MHLAGDDLKRLPVEKKISFAKSKGMSCNLTREVTLTKHQKENSNCEKSHNVARRGY